MKICLIPKSIELTILIKIWEEGTWKNIWDVHDYNQILVVSARVFKLLTAFFLSSFWLNPLRHKLKKAMHTQKLQSINLLSTSNLQLKFIDITYANRNLITLIKIWEEDTWKNLWDAYDYNQILVVSSVPSNCWLHFFFFFLIESPPP